MKKNILIIPKSHIQIYVEYLRYLRTNGELFYFAVRVRIP